MTLLALAGFRGLTNEVLHGLCAVVENAKAFYRVRERDCGIVKLKEVDGNEGQFNGSTVLQWSNAVAETKSPLLRTKS